MMGKSDKKRGLSGKEAAASFGISQVTFCEWEKKGWVVRFPDKSVDVESTRKQVDDCRNPILGGKADRNQADHLDSTMPAAAPVPAPVPAPDDDTFDMFPPDASASSEPEPEPDADMRMSEALRRLKRAQAKKAELELEVAKGNYIRREDAERVYCDSIAKARANLEAIPNRCAELLVGQTDAAVVRSMLTREIEGALAVVCGEVPSV